MVARFRWIGPGPSGIHRGVLGYDRQRTAMAAEVILSQGGWCVLEVCTDVSRQQWDPRVVIFDITPQAVADIVEQEVGHEPERDARLTGCDRRGLRPDPAMGAYLCYVAGDLDRRVARDSPRSPIC